LFTSEFILSVWSVQWQIRLTIPLAHLHPAKLSVFPPPVHVLINENILIAQIQNMFVLYIGPQSLCAELLFCLTSLKLHSSSAYSNGK